MAASFAAKRAANDEAKSRLLRQYAISPSVNTRRTKRSPYRVIVSPMRSISVASSPVPIMVIVSSPSYTSLPRPSDDFEWTKESWGAALRCGPLGIYAPHLFTTRQLELSSSEHVRALAHAIGAREVATVTQVHGREVAFVRKGSSVPHPRPEADALISDAADIAIAVRAADCVPLLMADRVRGVVAAVHAGWRGTAARVAVAAVDALAREFGTRPSDLVVAIGPSIGACCYEVGTELVDAFAAAGHERYLIDRWFLSAPPARGSMGRAPLTLDVARANTDHLILAGVPEDQIYASGLCTAMHLDVLTSYRKEKEKAGRIAGVIRATG
jgi:purine-nucleoside/S-methyl-5'-thioadenosine phosphorylase / adenosine deaminase